MVVEPVNDITFCRHSALQYDTQNYGRFCDESSNVVERLSFKGETESAGSVETTAH